MTLKEFRRKKGLDQSSIAKIIGVSVSYYSKVETGYRNPSYDFLKKFKEGFPNVSIDKIFFKKKPLVVIVLMVHDLFTSLISITYQYSLLEQCASARIKSLQ